VLSQASPPSSALSSLLSHESLLSSPVSALLAAQASAQAEQESPGLAFSGGDDGSPASN
jgi:hypothetical protein